jgi:outer membrane protein assembly factor BamE (lipoprotein component of BamABCDE complex)/HEAT repeat protein
MRATTSSPGHWVPLYRGATAALLTLAVIQLAGWPTEAPGQKPKPKPKPKSAASVNPNLTRENYEKIKDGMTFDEVRKILGGSSLSGRSKGDSSTYTWHRTSQLDPEHIVVHFKEGKVVSKSQTMKWTAADEKITPGLTRENYHRIKIDYTSREEVIARFGPPTRTDKVRTTTHLTWRQDRTEVRVVLGKGGRVSTKSNKQGWPDDERTVAAEKAMQRKMKLDRVELGMSEEEVTKIMGEPTKTERASAGRSGLLWEDGEDFALVLFRDKKAAVKDASLLPPASKDITRALFGRVHKGMSRAQVTALLGAPTEEMNGDTLVWRQGGKHIMVRFTGGKDEVTVRTSSEDRTPLLSFPKTDRDRLDAALAELRTFDAKRRRDAFNQIQSVPYLEDRAAEVSRAAQAATADKDTFVRQGAENVLKRWATKESAASALAVLNRPASAKLDDPYRDKRPLATAVLVKLRDPAAVAPLCKLLHSFFDRNAAEEALKDLGPEMVMKELAMHKTVRGYLEITNAFKADKNIVMTRCVEGLKSMDPSQRVTALSRLIHLPVEPRSREEVVNLLEGQLAEKSLYNAHLAATLLAKWGSAKSEPALLKALGEAESNEMKIAVCRALAEFGTKGAVDALRPLTKDLDVDVSGAAEKAIAAIEGRTK